MIEKDAMNLFYMGNMLHILNFLMNIAELKASKPLKQEDNYWFICKCGRAFKQEDKYREHKASHPKDFSVDWTLRGQEDSRKGSGGRRTTMHKCGQCGKLLQSAPALKYVNC